jgi:hypothetical protein
VLKAMKPIRILREVWFNELRIADMDNQGGMAAILSVDSNLADFATISATGKKVLLVSVPWNRDQTKEAVKIFNNIIS